MGAARSPFHLLVVLGAHVPEVLADVQAKEKPCKSRPKKADCTDHPDGCFAPCGPKLSRHCSKRTSYRRLRPCRDAPGGAAAVASLYVLSTGLDVVAVRGAAAVEFPVRDYASSPPDVVGADVGNFDIMTRSPSEPSAESKVSPAVPPQLEIPHDVCNSGVDPVDSQGNRARDTPFEEMFGDIARDVTRSPPLGRRAAVDVPTGDMSVWGLPPSGPATSSRHPGTLDARAQASPSSQDDTAPPITAGLFDANSSSSRNRLAVREYFCKKMCSHDSHDADGVLVPWSVLERLDPAAAESLSRELMASKTSSPSSAHLEAVKRKRSITLVMSHDNIAALTVISCLSLLGTIYLWKICTRRNCHCRICRNQYRSLYLLGSGGYGSVYLVERLGDGQRFVSKKILVREITEVDEYSREAKDLVQLRHRHIVSYEEDFVHVEYGALEPKTFFIIIMEYCPEGDLKEKIETEFMNFTEDWVRTVFAQLLQAVQYLHSKNVIHRDLKSQNVFLAKDGLVRLGDFGLCRRGGDHNAACRTSTLTHAGTDCYMAPEMLSSSRYGKPADMWSLGCVLYELCTGQFMWELDGMLGAMVMKDAQIVQKLVHDNVVAEVSSALSSLIKRLLSTNPASRPTATACMRKRLFKRGFQLSKIPFGESLEQLEAEADGDFSSRATSNIPLTITDFSLPSGDEKDESSAGSSSDEEAEAEASRSPATQKQNRKRKARAHRNRAAGRR